MYTIITVVLGMVSLIILDVVWIQGIALNLYKNMFPLTISFDLGPALLVYFILAVAIRYFVIGADRGKVYTRGVLGRGLLLGVVTYGVYNLTNLATLSSWTIAFSFLDIISGSITVMFASLFVFLVLPLFE
jgi:uncharacterized membrane protein